MALSDASGFRRVQQAIVAAANSQLRTAFQRIDVRDPRAATDALEILVPGLTDAFGDLSATLAADFYDERRLRSTARTLYVPTTAPTVDHEHVRISVRWAVTPLFRPRDDFASQTLSNLELVTDRFVKAPGRDTIVLNAERDPARARLLRVGGTFDACDHCRAQEARGSVAVADEAFRTYHGGCSCVPVPVW